MHYQQFLAISSLFLTGVLSAPVPDLVTKGNGINSAADDAYEFKIAFSDEAKLVSNPAWAQILKDPALKSTILKNNPVNVLHPKRDVASAADDAYEFKIAFSDEAKLASNPAWAQILKDPAIRNSILKNNPVLTNPIKGLHPKRDIASAADDAYEFKIAFSDEAKLASNPAWAQILKDPAIRSSILKNNNPVLTNPIKGLHPKRDVGSAADEAYEFVIKFSDESKLASNPAWAQILKDPAFKGSILKNNPVLTNPIKSVHIKRDEAGAAEEA